MNEKYKHILDDNETIIAIYKPNKLRFYFMNFLAFTVIWLFLTAFMLFATLVSFEDGENLPLWTFYIFAGVLILSLSLNLIILKLSYKKREYSYTNKRILIQSGIIGIDYKSLDHKMIGATEVRVDVIDKILQKNTGTLRFGSQASPMNQQNFSMFTFNGIVDPYNVYREIKKHIDSVKA